MGLNPISFPPLEIASPCGLLAKYFPKDQFLELYEKELVTDQGLKEPEQTDNLPITSDEVADKFFKRGFRKVKSSSATKQWTDVTNGLFINWMVD